MAAAHIQFKLWRERQLNMKKNAFGMDSVDFSTLMALQSP